MVCDGWPPSAIKPLDPAVLVSLGMKIVSPEEASSTAAAKGGGTWAFEVMILEEADDIEEYDIGVTDSAL